ncbi:MAG TPA: MFS transporter, partial [Anaerolineales bacterium]|nr:MFS transporter [Anaerolineales bacterium]
INLNHFFVTFGSIVIVVYLTYLQMDWREAVTQSAGVVLLLAIYFLAARLRPHDSGDRYLDRIKILARERAVIALFLLSVLVVGVEAASIGILTTYLMDFHGFTQLTSKIALTVYLVGVAAGRIAIGLFARQDRIYTLLAALLALAIFTFSALFFVGLGDLTLAAVFLAGLATSALLPLVLSLASLLFPATAGTVMGTIKIAIPLGGIVIPFVMSLVSSSLSFQASLLVFPIALLLGLILILTSRSSLAPAAELTGFEEVSSRAD